MDSFDTTMPLISIIPTFSPLTTIDTSPTSASQYATVDLLATSLDTAFFEITSSIDVLESTFKGIPNFITATVSSELLSSQSFTPGILFSSSPVFEGTSSVTEMVSTLSLESTDRSLSTSSFSLVPSQSFIASAPSFSPIFPSLITESLTRIEETRPSDSMVASQFFTGSFSTILSLSIVIDESLLITKGRSLFFTSVDTTLSPTSIEPAYSTSDALLTFSTSTIQPTPTFGPILLNPLGILVVDEGQPFEFELPMLTFFSQNDLFQLTLHNSSNGQLLPSTSWIQISSNNVIEGLALHSEIDNGFITDHTFTLVATDNRGLTSTDTFIVRVFPQTAVESFVIFFVDGNFTDFILNLPKRLEFVKKLNGLSQQNEVFVKNFSSGSIGIVFANLSISRLNCLEFLEWYHTIYVAGDYSLSFRNRLEPFMPIGVAEIIGPCAEQQSQSSILLIVPSTVFIGSQLSENIIILATVIPCLILICLLLLMGGLLCLSYRQTRPERKNLRSKEIFLNREPIILPGELEAIPYPSRKPIILPGEQIRKGYLPLLHEDNTETLAEFVEDEEKYEEELIDVSSHTTNVELPPAYKFPSRQLAYLNLNKQRL